MIVGKLFEPGSRCDVSHRGGWEPATVRGERDGVLTLKLDCGPVITRHVRYARGRWPGQTVVKPDEVLAAPPGHDDAGLPTGTASRLVRITNLDAERPARLEVEILPAA